MINNKNFKLTFFAVFMAIELFIVKKTYYGLIRFRSVLNTPAFINGIIGFFIMLIILTFLRKDYFDKENNKATIISILKMFSLIILFIVLLSLINGFISLAVYKSISPFKDINYIKGIINIISFIVSFILSPLLLILFWNGLKEDNIILSYKKHFNLKEYCKYLCLILTASFFGFITSLLMGIIKNQLISDLLSLFFVSLFGSLSIIISEKIYDSDFIVKKIHKKIISLIIIISITFECMCPTVYANEFDTTEINTTEYDEYIESDNNDEGIENTEPIDFNREEEVTDIQSDNYEKEDVLKMPQDYYYIEEPLGELVAASEDSRTYQISERSFITQIGGTSFVYEDESGELCVVDNTLEESEDGYENKANDYSINLPTNITDTTGIKINKDGYDIELIPLDGDFSKAATADNAILYNDVFDGVDYQYTVLGDLIKEDIVLNKNIEKNTFRFRIEADELYISLNDGVILITKENPEETFNEESLEPLYTILAPDMTDASGNVSNNVALSLENIDNSYIATITVDSEWLNDVERAYPVRIDPTINIGSDNIGLYGVEQGSPDSIIGDNRYPYSGYDDGIASSNLFLFNTMHLMTRTYVSIDYDFSQISKEAKIDSATFSLYHYTAYSEGTTNFGLYSVDSSWSGNSITWNNQLNIGHTFIGYQRANPSGGYLNWDIRDTVNSWVNGLSSNNGFVVKAENENTMQCEVFYNKNGVYKPQITIAWSIPDPVDVNYPLDEITVNLRPITEKNVAGKLNFDGVFADGTATPEAAVNYSIVPAIDGGISSASTTASLSYKYPDTDLFNDTFPDGTKYKDKLSNYQTGLYTGIPLDTIYKISAQAQKNGNKSSTKYSDEFLVYKIKELDTFPYIARYYGVPYETLMKDNHVHDTLVVENNTIFIRNPKTSVAYTPEEKDVDSMTAIDAALMGRGLHCEYGFEPINLNTGNFYYNTVDSSINEINGEFNIERSYNSKAVSGSSYFGRNWIFGYDEHLSLKSDGSIAYKLGDGKILYFKPNGSGGYISPAGYNYTLNRTEKIIGTGEESYTLYTYTITDGDGVKKSFNACGLMTSIEYMGLTTTLTYDDSYILDYITSPSGKKYNLTLDEQGRITSITLPNSAVLRYSYDSSGNLTTYTDADGNRIRYSYDSYHNMTAWYDGNGTRIVKNTYDDKGRVTSQIDAAGNKATLSYSNNQTKTTDANGNVTIYKYDSQYRTTKIEYADGTTEKYTYDSNNNLASDNLYTYTYDSRGNMLTQKRKDGKIQKYTYNSANQVTSITDYDGTKINFTYNNKDLTAITYPDGSKDRYSYNANHQMTVHTDKNGNKEQFEYNKANLISYTDYNGNTYKYSYNSMNQCITTIYPDGNVSRITYSSSGNKTSEIYPDGSIKKYSINKAGYVTSITNNMGYTSDFAYDGLGNITRAVDPLGNTIEYTYDGNGNKKTEKDLNGHITEYEYDCHNRIIKIIYAKGETNERSVSYTYDEHNNILTVSLDNALISAYEYNENTDSLIKETDAIGNVTTYENDTLGRPETVNYSDGRKISFAYNYMGKITEYKDVTGIITEYIYDADGNPIETITNDEVRTSYIYDANGNLLSVTDTLGGLITYTYDSMNNCISYTDKNGGTYEYTYDYMRNITSVKNPANDISSFEYDKLGNLILKTDYNDAVTEYYYDAAGNIISSKDALGNITNYSYDGNGQLLTKTDIYGYETSMEYDAFGNVVKLTDAEKNELVLSYDNMDNLIKTELSNGDISEYSYDELGRIINKTDAAGLKTEYTYDDMSRLLSETDNTGRKEEYKYDKYGRITEITDTIGRTVSYEYDTYSNISKITDYDGNVITYDYDLMGNNTEIDIKDGAKQLYEYDAAGNVTSYTIGDKTYRYEYDTLNRIISKTSPSGIVKGYEYDCMSNLISATDGNNVKTSYEYDLMGNLVKSTDGNGGSYTYTYDKLSRLISEVTPNGSTTEYIYDSLNRITKIKDASGYVTELDYDLYGNIIRSKSERGAVLTYEYDKHNNLISETDALGNTTTYDVDLTGLVKSITYPNDSVYTYDYDEINRLTDIESPNGYKVSFNYDDAGNMSSKEDNLDRKTLYEYDKFHHLISVTDPEGEKESYEYDIYDNLVSHTSVSGSKTTYSYDIEDRLSSIADAEDKITLISYDNEGNITGIEKSGDRKTTYKYDNNYNLIEEINPMGYAVSYEYDSDDNISKVTDALGQSVEYTYDALNQITGIKDIKGALSLYSYDAHGNITEYTDAKGNKISYTYNLNDELIKVRDKNGTITAYEYDSVGNMIRQTDARGKITDYEYDAENNLTQITSSYGTVEKLTYDIAGNLKSLIYPDGTTINYDYDKLNRLIEKEFISDNEESSVTYAYDTDGNRISMDDSTGNTAYTYDILGRVTSVTDSNDKEIHYSYDEAGRIDAITYADGSKISYEYDKNDNIIRVSSPAGDTTYTYDGLDRVVKEERPDNSSTEFEYEGYDLKSIINKDETGQILSSFTYEYDTLGYITKETASQKVIDEEGESRLVNAVRLYEYTDSGEIKEFTETQDKETITYTFTYDEAGNRTSLNISGAGKDEIIKYEYSDTNRLILKTSSISGVTSYEYDQNGNLIFEANGDIEKTYEYTVEQRLAAVREGGTVLMAASYDGDGNRIFTASRRILENEVEEEKKENGYNTVVVASNKKEDNETEESATETDNQKEDISSTEKDTDEDNSEEISVSDIESTDNVKISDKNIFLYGFAQESILLTGTLNETEGIVISRWLSSVWNFDDNATADDSADDTPNDKKDKEGDDDNKPDDNQDDERDRNERLLDEAGLTEAEKATIIIPYTESSTEYKTIETEDYALTYYVNDITKKDTQVLMEYGSQNELKNSYIYGNERITKIEYTDNPSYNYYMYDGRGSVAQLINDKAELKASYTYDVYGNVTYGSNLYDSFYGYNAEETNPVTGLEYLRARYYDSETGRFNTLDSYLGDIVNPQSLNRYVYAENNPVNKIDPSGHKSRKTTKITSNINTPVNNGLTLIGVLIAAGGYVYKKHVEKEAQNNNDNIEKTNNRLAKKHREFGDVAKSIEYAEYKGIHASLSDRIENYTSYPLSNEAYQKQRYLDKVYEGGEILSEIALLSFEKRLQCDKSKKLDRKNTFANGAIMIGSGVALLGLTPYVAEAALAETGTLAIADTSLIGGVTYRMAAEGITTFVGATEYSLGASELIEGATGFNPISDVLLPNDKELYEGIVDDVNIATNIGMTYGFYGYIYDNMYNNKPPIPPDEAAAKKYADNGGSGTRPTWRQSEIDAKADFPDYNEQVSFMDGKEVPYGTKGSVRPDYYKAGSSVDIKNYNVETATGRSNLANNISKQYYQRSTHLPQGTKQYVLIDVRGQNVSNVELEILYNSIMEKTNNGITVYFKTN